MKQQTLTGFERYGRTTRPAQFLADTDQVIPWPNWRRRCRRCTRKSARTADGQCDLAMHQTAKDPQWYFGMTAHIGVDSRTKPMHPVLAMAVNVADRDARPFLLHGNETRVRATVEHVFKNLFGFRQTRYRGLAKNLHRLEVTAALTNLYLVRRRLLKA
jgi:transposase, IS5 family